ncbi:uncharacterized protein LOC135715120 [Ochlerotatus camptorhynchus]|uniref:uncharacterized protein LOC135715120 n=1 Tax=Ochlerotatus camptorhynchus TaxID=644619 RepID=UPI0031E0D129
MKAFIVCLAIASVGVSALPEYYGNYQQQWPQQEQWSHQQLPQQPEQPQWGQEMQWQQPQPQPQAQEPQMYQQNMSPDGYKIVPGVVDSRCPRSDDPKNPTHLAIRGDCSKFMKCYGGRAYEMSCPAGLEFGSTVNRCDYPALARCSNGGY